jgi:hypothetical protein
MTIETDSANLCEVFLSVYLILSIQKKVWERSSVLGAPFDNTADKYKWIDGGLNLRFPYLKFVFRCHLNKMHQSGIKD